MKQIKDETIYTYEIKKSVFIGVLLKISNKEETRKKLESIKEQYKNATHYCYALRLENYEKYSDDKEPSKTAGLPILQVLQMNELTNVLCVVIRYFGGIKLGASALTRTYRKVASDAIKKATLISYEKMYNIEITFPYEEEAIIKYHLNEDTIKDKKYQKEVTYQIEETKEQIEFLKELFKNKPTIKIKEKESLE